MTTDDKALAPTTRELVFTDEQQQLIRDTFANGASPHDFAVLMEIARARRLNPLLRQIHFVQRWDANKSRTAWSVQVSIDGLRAIAERTGLYAGQDEPEFVDGPEGPAGLPVCCKVRVYRKDWTRPAVGVAYWTEAVQVTRDKTTNKERPNAMWGRMPRLMLAKVAEALAIRKAFPEDTSGLYTGDEIASAEERTEAAPLAPPQRVEPRALPEPTVVATVPAEALCGAQAVAPRAPESAPVQAFAPSDAAEPPSDGDLIAMLGELAAASTLEALEATWIAQKPVRLCMTAEQADRAARAFNACKRALAQPPPDGTDPKAQRLGAARAALASAGGTVVATGTTGGPTSLARSLAAHLAAKPRARPGDPRTKTRELAEVAHSYLKRRAEYVAAGCADEALDVVRAELLARGCADPDALLQGVAEHVGRSTNTTPRKQAA